MELPVIDLAMEGLRCPAINELFILLPAHMVMVTMTLIVCRRQSIDDRFNSAADCQKVTQSNGAAVPVIVSVTEALIWRIRWTYTGCVLRPMHGDDGE